MNLKISLLFISIFLIIGCAEKQTLDMDTKPKYQVQKKIAPSISNKGSLYSRKGPSLFADKKDLQIGDIIRVIINLDETTESEVKRNSDSIYESGKTIGTFTSPNNRATENTARKLNSAIGLGFDTVANSDFDATAKSSTTDTINTEISVIIEQVYQNGNYFIKGSRETLIQGQKLTVKISGVIRPYDIDTIKNQVEEKQIANLKVVYEKDGEEVDIIEKKWGTRLIDAIWPF